MKRKPQKVLLRGNFFFTFEGEIVYWDRLKKKIIYVERSKTLTAPLKSITKSLKSYVNKVLTAESRA